MDGRTAVVAGLLVFTASTGCAPWGPLLVAAGIGTASSDVYEIRSSPRGPRLGKIFREGRYTFVPDPVTQEHLGAQLEEDPGAAAAFDEIVAKGAIRRNGREAMFAIAMILTEDAVRDPKTWRRYLRSAEDQVIGRLDRYEILGADTAWGRSDDHGLLEIRYSSRLFIRLAAKPSIPRGKVEELARYLLKPRDEVGR